MDRLDGTSRDGAGVAARPFAFVSAGLLALAGVVLFVAGQSSAMARVAMSAEPEHPIAVAAIPKLVNELLESDRFVPDRERAQEEFQARLSEVETRMREIATKYEGRQPDPQDPQVQQDNRRYQELMQEAQRIQQEAQAALQRLASKQLIEAFGLARSAAQGVAEDLGYDYVISSVGEDEELVEGDPGSAVRQMMSRPVVHYPEEADITADVRAELRL
ncbi:MAG: OmpH family outer membrane protein [Phycisphaerales bacterium]